MQGAQDSTSTLTPKTSVNTEDYDQRLSKAFADVLRHDTHSLDKLVRKLRGHHDAKENKKILLPARRGMTIDLRPEKKESGIFLADADRADKYWRALHGGV